LLGACSLRLVLVPYAWRLCLSLQLLFLCGKNITQKTKKQVAQFYFFKWENSF
tara:strand:+ start:125 stop:283 length:159 start_codon:yes stop_codon:yes gene_type:complete